MPSRRVCTTDLEFLRFDGGGARPADVAVAEVTGGVKVLLGGDVARVGALLGDLRLRREEEQRQFRTQAHRPVTNTSGWKSSSWLNNYKIEILV